MTNEKPRYEHHCIDCVFLGYLDKFDLYYCPVKGQRTVIARFGNDSDYYSGLWLVDKYPELAEAKRRAIARELL